MIAILGESSFLGRNLGSYFENKGLAVSGFSSRPEKIDDFLRSQVVFSDKLDAVIICGASQNQGDEKESILELVKANVEFPAIIASFLIKNSPKTKLIHFGSSWQTSETGEEDPFNLYAASKSAGENLLRHYANRGLKIASLRLFDTYGEGDTRPKLINLILKTIISRDPIDTTKGEQPFELIHIIDVCKAVEQVLLELDSLQENDMRTYDVGPNEEHTVQEVIKLACKLSEVDESSLFRFGAKPYRENERMNFSAKNPVPGWQPTISLEVGLQKLLKTN